MISIDWDTKIISVPKVDTTLIQISPMEIRELNLDGFRLILKSIEDNEDGMIFPDTHNHNPPVAVGGVTLARVIELINDYTVTFEDGQYAVNLVGANSNVGDNINVNQVSVRSANSAGLLQTREIEHASFNGAVTVDVVKGSAGTLYPTGTQVKPVNNIPDALLIAQVRGFDKLAIIGAITLDTGDDVRELHLFGDTMHRTAIIINAGGQTENVEMSKATVSGTMDGPTHIIDCQVNDLSGVSGHFHSCLLAGTIVLTGSGPTQFIKCVDALPGAGTPVIDLGGSGRDVGIWGYHGGLLLINKTGSDKVSVNLDSGRLILDSTITNGQILVKGVGILIDNSTGSADVDSSGLVNPTGIAAEVWAYIIAGNILNLTAGRSLGLCRKILNNRLELAEGDTNNWILYDDDDSTPVLTYDVTDKSGNAITIIDEVPARRTRGV